MTLRNDAFVRSFALGRPSESASRMEYQEIDGYDCIVGYGWAIYAAWIDGELVVFVGWRGYSSTTSRHINLIVEWGDRLVDAEPRVESHLRNDDRPTLEEWLEDGE